MHFRTAPLFSANWWIIALSSFGSLSALCPHKPFAGLIKMTRSPWYSPRGRRHCSVVNAGSPSAYQSNNEHHLILEPVKRQVHRFRPREFRSHRQKLAPSPDVAFNHPLFGTPTTLKIHDISGSGFSVEEQKHTAVLLPGMIIPSLDLIFSDGNILALYRPGGLQPISPRQHNGTLRICHPRYGSKGAYPASCASAPSQRC